METDFHKIKPFVSVMQNSLWHHDAYPDLPDLEPQGKIEIFRAQGAGIVRTIHLTLNIEGGNRDKLLRGVFLKAIYNGLPYSSVLAPVGDFFCDSFGGASIPFAAAVMAKRPTNSLYCHLPMPYEKSIILELVNTTAHKVTGYGYVTAEKTPAWEPDNAYFHAKWVCATVRLPEDKVVLLDTRGRGHFLGCHLTAVSPCPHFAENQGICEGNDEFYIDGAAEPVCNYLGTEDFFGFSWNWRTLWADARAGTTYLSEEGGVTRLACYRFLVDDPVRFSRSLLARINYEHEKKNEPLNSARRDGNGDVEFGIVVYWYQDTPLDQASV